MSLRPPWMSAIQPADVLFALYSVVMLAIIALRAAHVDEPGRHALTHLAVLAAGCLIVVVEARTRRRASFFLKLWYIPMIAYYVFFAETGGMIHILCPVYWDARIFGLEEVVFGGWPNQWMQSIEHPVLTEVMSLSYLSYYVYIPLLGVPLYLMKRLRELNDLILAATATYFVCYLHFLMTPTGGPIFFEELPFALVPLEGGPITGLEQWLFQAGTIDGGAFPSSHVAVASAVTVLSLRQKVMRPFFLVVTPLLCLSTVYNGYHYAVDVVYGALIGTGAALAAPPVNAAWRRRFTAEER
jgi:membrane-associated phospholipid phosphatase